MEKKIGLKLNTKPHTGFGIFSFAFGCASFILFLIAVLGVAFYLEDGQVWPGLFEVIAFVFALAGLIFGVVGVLQLDVKKTFAHLGILLNGFMMVVHLIVIIQGF